MVTVLVLAVLPLLFVPYQLAISQSGSGVAPLRAIDVPVKYVPGSTVEDPRPLPEEYYA